MQANAVIAAARPIPCQGSHSGVGGQTGYYQCVLCHSTVSAIREEKSAATIYAKGRDAISIPIPDNGLIAGQTEADSYYLALVAQSEYATVINAWLDNVRAL